MEDGVEYYLCPSHALENGGKAEVFDVVYGGQTCRAFAIRYEGQVHAYLNRCSHVAMEMDYQEGRFFDQSKKWLICATHGALYEPQSGKCTGGPCKSGLFKIEVLEKEDGVYWLSAYNLKRKDNIFD
jgi:nitrite reductase/ring-hydroxylating ferredoxin subunit